MTPINLVAGMVLSSCFVIIVSIFLWKMNHPVKRTMRWSTPAGMITTNAPEPGMCPLTVYDKDGVPQGGMMVPCKDYERIKKEYEMAAQGIIPPGWGAIGAYGGGGGGGGHIDPLP